MPANPTATFFNFMGCTRSELRDGIFPSKEPIQN